MYSAFTERPNYAPYNLQQNQIPLTLGAPGYPSTLVAPVKHMTPAERKDFHPQGIVPADMRSVYRAWQRWLAQQASISSTGRTG